MLCRRIFVSGRVQGVFFRDSTRREALALGVAGWARNRHDGRVEVLAAGSPEAVAALEKWLQSGPPMAKVTNIEAMDAGETCEDIMQDPFTILPTS